MLKLVPCHLELEISDCFHRLNKVQTAKRVCCWRVKSLAWEAWKEWPELPANRNTGTPLLETHKNWIKQALKAAQPVRHFPWKTLWRHCPFAAFNGKIKMWEFSLHIRWTDLTVSNLLSLKQTFHLSTFITSVYRRTLIKKHPWKTFERLQSDKFLHLEAICQRVAVFFFKLQMKDEPKGLWY